MTKAFDFISYKLLLNKIFEYSSIRSNKNLSSKSPREITYGQEHRKSSNIKNKTVERGVPQGGILGPLLFIRYINDLPDHVKQKMFSLMIILG